MADRKKYTARELRHTAEAFALDSENCLLVVVPSETDKSLVASIRSMDVAAMLRQAADAMEQESNSSKEYRVEVLENGEWKPYVSSTFKNLNRACRVLEDSKSFIGNKKNRLAVRSVSEWSGLNQE